MQSRNVKWLLAFSAIALGGLLLSAARPSLAQGWGCRMMSYSHGGWNSQVPEKYWLTADQKSKIGEIHSKYDQKILPMQQELRALRLEARGYKSRSDANVGKIKSYRKEIRDLEEKIEDLRLEARTEGRKLLTEEQRAYFGDNYDWWGPDWGMMDARHGHDMCPMMSDHRSW